ncbi:hypothetical protein [Streptomyces coelicoflavus]
MQTSSSPAPGPSHAVADGVDVCRHCRPDSALHMFGDVLPLEPGTP